MSTEARAFNVMATLEGAMILARANRSIDALDKAADLLAPTPAREAAASAPP